MDTVALVHDYLTQQGGAERVVLSMAHAFPDAPLYTSLYYPKGTFPALASVDVRPLTINAIPGLRRNHRLALPLLAPAFSMRTVDAPVTLISSSGWAHGVRVSGRKVVFCYSPARWLYQRERYLGSGRSMRRAALKVLSAPLTRWDRRSAQSAHRYLCVSRATQQRISESYGIAAEILHPPVTIDANRPQTPIPGIEPGFLLCVSRLLPYKNVDAIIRAVASMPDTQLVVVGDGPEHAQLRTLAGGNVRFTGLVDDARLRWLYANCAGLVAASYEDYGLTPLEAASFGRPVAALRGGGYLDTVIEHSTGVFFDSPTSTDIAAALRELLDNSWSTDLIKRHASTFDEASFITRLRNVVSEEARLA